MIDIEELKPQIIERLKPLNPDKIILFGSYAYGEPNEDSDIDLYVVTSDEFFPQNFDENMQVKLKVSRQLRDLQGKITIDTVTHTKPMYEKFVEMDGMFSRKILKDGIRLYEKIN